MEKTMTMKYIVLLFLVTISCNRNPSKEIVKNEFKQISQSDYKTFIGWNLTFRLYKVLLCDRFENEHLTNRWLVKINKGEILAKSIFPTESLKFTPLDSKNDSLNFALSKNVHIFISQRVNSIIYNKVLDAVIITTASNTYLHNFSDKVVKRLSPNYKKINDSWYLYINH